MADYRFEYWQGRTAEQITVAPPTLPGCPGSWKGAGVGGCTGRPDHVVSYWTNPSGLPGLGKAHIHTVCSRHLNGVLRHAYKVAAGGGPVTLSKYEGE